MRFLEPSDIAMRLYRRHPIWKNEPKILLIGKKGTFGKLKFMFGYRTIEYSIYIANRGQIERAARNAIDWFSQLIQKEYNFR